jgi:bifunctional non-homologous end joining protein LigD
LTHLDKVYWPEDKLTKGDLIEYYIRIAPFILPHLKNRPIVLHRFPDGINGEGFFQKEVNFTPPKWLKTHPVVHEDKTIDYLFINDLRSLLYAVNLGSIDLHPFLSRYQSLEFPDYCVIDLDPENLPYDITVQVALAVHDLLDELGVNHYCKTSGARGMHVYIPFHAKYSHEQSRNFAEIIALKVNQRLPEITSLERNPSNRQQKVYLDYLQNRTRQTMCAPYCVRPRPHAPVSTPLHWDEVKKGLDPADFTIKTIPARLDQLGDIFKPVLDKGVDLKLALARFTPQLGTSDASFCNGL